MKCVLTWKVNNDWFVFSCLVDSSHLPVEQWATHEVCLPEGGRGGLGPILGLLEDEVAQVENDKTVIISHEAIANLDANDLNQIGLPEPMPFNLSIDGQGLLTDLDFRFRYRLVHSDSRPVMGVRRTGALIEVGERRYIISEPFFSLIRGMETHNALPPEDIEGRFLAWATIKEHLPEDVIVGDYLKSLRIVKPDAFTLTPFINPQGEPDFDPVLIWSMLKNTDAEPDGKALDFENALPRAPQDRFAEQFRQFQDARGRYALPGGWYLVLPKPLRNALSVVREALGTAPEQRRDFMANPRALLKERLEGEFEEEILEDLFYESAVYSDRVKKIGVWQPPVLPYISPGTEPWLPPEEFGLRVGDTLIQVDSVDVAEVLKQVEKAIIEGKDSIEYKSQLLPASHKTVEALKGLIGKIRPKKKETDEKDEEEETEKTTVALLIRGNLDQLDYRAHRRNVRGELGSLPAYINTLPYAHQLRGIRWLQEHWVSGSSGALLADDMGLGKTLDALAFMTWVKEQMDDNKHPRRPMIVVAPTGLLKNWVDEHDKHLEPPGLGKVVRAYGTELRALRHPRTGPAEELVEGLPVLDVTRLREADWLLTTYETLRDYQHSFGQIHFAVIVFDEAQKIKNPSVLMTDAAKAMNSDLILTMTGTPVENRLSDLWCIVDTAKPGRLGSLKQFSSLYEKKANEAPERLHELKQLLTEEKENFPMVMLRRMKEDHLEGLPQKHENMIETDMPEPQATAYEEAVQLARTGKRGRGRMLEALHALRSISLHPFLKGQESDEEYVNASARLIATFRILDKIAEGKGKALLFIESRQMQGVLAEIIQRRYHMSTPPLLINGQVSGMRRKERVDIFQLRLGFDVMLLSPKAGGVGLTLTAANHVIHLSRWWNPAVEDQCTDRIFRIGQDRSVHVYYPMAIHPHFKDHSFDLCLHALLKRKRNLSRTVLAPPAATHQDTENLFRETVDSEQQGNSDPFAGIDTMEPEAFETWVLEHLAGKGYQVQRTPRSWDCGADGLAIAPKGSDKPNLILQCKHSQSNRPCGTEAIREIVGALDFYAQSDQPFQPVVVTNSSKFSEEAIRLAGEQGVQLVDRSQLCKWPY